MFYYFTAAGWACSLVVKREWRIVRYKITMEEICLIMGIYRNIISLMKNLVRMDCRVASAPRNDAKPVITTLPSFLIYPRNDCKLGVIVRRTSVSATKQSILFITTLFRKFYNRIKRFNANPSLFVPHNSLILTIVLLMSTLNACQAFDLDMTVDDDIRKNYNASKLVKDTHTEADDGIDETLPALPAIIENEPVKSTEKQTQPTAQKKEMISSSSSSPVYPRLKIHAGASFDVVSSTKINDWLAKGNTIRFKTTTPVVKKKYTIPSGTVFTGKIIEVHQPQITCNGGLVVIRINSMNYKGQNIPVKAYITRADEKLVFLNNIKGRRTYLKTVWKKGNWGRTLFNKMLTMTINLGGEGSTILLSPFPVAYGTICLGLNTLVSPFCAFFSKGGHVSIPAGSEFRIKLLDDVYID